MLIKAVELSQEHGWFLPRQFENEANAWIHSETTGPELLEAASGSEGGGKGGGRLDHLFLSYGTGGTLKGVAQHLRQHSPDTKIHVCEPDCAPMLYSELGTQWNEDGTVQAAHPLWYPRS